MSKLQELNEKTEALIKKIKELHKELDVLTSERQKELDRHLASLKKG